ncbi:MAG: hypothetical protein WC926_01620 [Candidatus Paceibacterota bacterium]|jgi:hypothetical protein
MDAIYYKELDYCPVKVYLSQYLEDTQLLISIRQKIKFIKEKEGRPIPPYAKQLRGYAFLEIRQKHSSRDILIRILYFCYKNKMVLLSAFDKPDHYETQAIRKKIKKNYDFANLCRKKFLSNPNLYEKYKE